MNRSRQSIYFGGWQGSTKNDPDQHTSGLDPHYAGQNVGPSSSDVLQSELNAFDDLQIAIARSGHGSGPYQQSNLSGTDTLDSLTQQFRETRHDLLRLEPWNPQRAQACHRASVPEPVWPPSPADQVAFGSGAMNIMRRLDSTGASVSASGDSGYGSINAKPSMGELGYGQSAFGAGLLAPVSDKTLKPSGSVYSDGHLQTRGRSTRSRSRAYHPPCITCGKALKTPSDAHKHSLQHTKPHHCNEHGCTRSEGFATSNDLDRHRKCVHSLNALVGIKTGFVCAACSSEAPDTVPKFWPRRDNFRAHIKRKHPSPQYDEKYLLQISERKRPTETASDPGYAPGGYSFDSQFQVEPLFSADLENMFQPNLHQGVDQSLAFMVPAGVPVGDYTYGSEQQSWP